MKFYSLDTESNHISSTQH